MSLDNGTEVRVNAPPVESFDLSSHTASVSASDSSKIILTPNDSGGIVVLHASSAEDATAWVAATKSNLQPQSRNFDNPALQTQSRSSPASPLPPAVKASPYVASTVSAPEFVKEAHSSMSYVPPPNSSMSYVPPPNSSMSYVPPPCLGLLLGWMGGGVSPRHFALQLQTFNLLLSQRWLSVATVKCDRERAACKEASGGRPRSAVVHGQPSA
jgi:hypothetical protein